MSYKIKEVADIAGISVRTLHHYDEIELLKPSTVTNAGYRIYLDADLKHLQQILFLKELDFSLTEIKDILCNEDYNRIKAMENQKQLLITKRNRLDKIIQLVESTIDSYKGGNLMSNQEMFDAFDMSEIEEHQKKYAKEAKQKYSNTEAYKQSDKKTSNYTKEDWGRITKQADEIYTKLAGLMDRNVKNEEVQQSIGEWRQHITANFYNCTLEIFRGLGDLYVSDERFTANIDKYRPGLASFMKEAIYYYCDIHEE